MSESGLFAFPPPESLETPRVLRALIDAHRHLAELKGMARSIPNSRLLISTLSLQEAQSSSEIENIITTQDAGLVRPGSGYGLRGGAGEGLADAEHHS